MSNDDGQSLLPAWRDASLPVADRVAYLAASMTRREKIAQLSSVWVAAATEGEEVAPHQSEFTAGEADVTELVKWGLGQLTRPFGTAAVAPADGVASLAQLQSEIMGANRFGIPALVHEECLSGFMASGATVYPTPLAWAATFDAELIERMARQIADSMRGVGVHQGLGPVLDVTVDSRWGRTEETLGEDPYLVATLATAYVRGLQAGGVIATLKHFVGYSASRAARNFGPVSIGPRELADTFLLPFEMAIHRGGAGSVMPSYNDIDGVPVAASRSLLTDLLRDQWGFTGTVVSDYFGVSFLRRLHTVAADSATAAALALRAGVDTELPSVDCFAEPLYLAVENGLVDPSFLDRALERVLRQKCELGLFDPDWSPVTAETDIDLDPPAHRALARRVAEESVVLLSNRDTALPLENIGRLTVVGPVADLSEAMLGCYAFPNHVEHDPATGVDIASVLSALREEFREAAIEFAPGCDVADPNEADIDEAVAVAERSDVCVAVLGDRSGLFGRGTSGEGCDREDLALPGVQGGLLDALLATGTPVVLVLLTGRPYALGAACDRAAAIVQAFFPGEEGGAAIAGVLSGRVNPSGRLPVSVPERATAPPPTYFDRRLARLTEVSSVDPTSLYPFGHGLSYAEFAWDEPLINGEAPAEVSMATDGSCTVSTTVRNTSGRAGTEVVQLYLHHPAAQVTQPHARLVGYARVALVPGQARTARFTVSADLASFTGVAGKRIVEPGPIRLWLAASSRDIRHTFKVTLTGDERRLDHHRAMTSEVELI